MSEIVERMEDRWNQYRDSALMDGGNGNLVDDCESAFKAGYEAAVYELQPELRQVREALDKVMNWANKDSIAPVRDEAEQAIATLDTLIEPKS